MEINKFFIMAILFVLVLNCNSQILFNSFALKDLYERLPETEKNTILEFSIRSQNSDMDTLVECNGQNLSVSLREGEIRNLGIYLNNFHDQISYDSIVNTFLGRVLLRLSFDSSIPDVISTAETMQIRILYQDTDLLFAPIENFNELLDKISSATQFKLAKNNSVIVAEWAKDDHSIKMVFPNNYQLLVGKNKKELDREVLLNLGERASRSSLIEFHEEPLSSNNDMPIVVIKGSMYMNQLSSDIYYRTDGKDSILVFEEGQIPLSVSNLFLNKELMGNRSLQMDQKVYGGKSISINLLLRSFDDFFKADYQGFVGLEKNDQDLIEGTVVYRHVYFNYIHLLHFKLNRKDLFIDNCNIVSDFYANIPMHNVKDLFKEFESQETPYKIDIISQNP